MVANFRYWPTVAPVVRSELAQWQAPAASIDDRELRSLAISKQQDERFNAEVAATLATLAPRSARATATRAMVSLELLFDYLDGRTELPMSDQLKDAERLFGVFTGAIEPPDLDGAVNTYVRGEDDPDRLYTRALAQRTRENLYALPGAAPIARVAKASAERCAQAQARMHAAATLGGGELREWASEHGQAGGLEWRAYLGGSMSSVLAVHALIAAAADPAATEVDATRIDRVYLAIAGVITMLDSLVDHSEDLALGKPGFGRLFDTPEELGRSVCALTREALARTREAPHGSHHAMTLAGVLAYYTTHPGARDRHARGTVAAVRAELSPTIWPTLAVMVGWRAAKRTRAHLSDIAGRNHPPGDDSERQEINSADAQGRA